MNPLTPAAVARSEPTTAGLLPDRGRRVVDPSPTSSDLSDHDYRMATTLWIRGIESPCVVVNVTVCGRVNRHSLTAAS